MEGSIRSLRLSGDIDVACKKEFAALLEPCATVDLVILDFAEVTFFDSSAIGCLIALHRRMHEHGTKAAIRIVAPSATVRRVLELTNLTSMFSLYDTGADAERDGHAEASEHLAAPGDILGTLERAV